MFPCLVGITPDCSNLRHFIKFSEKYYFNGIDLLPDYMFDLPEEGSSCIELSPFFERETPFITMKVNRKESLYVQKKSELAILEQTTEVKEGETIAIVPGDLVFLSAAKKNGYVFNYPENWHPTSFKQLMVLFGYLSWTQGRPVTLYEMKNHSNNLICLLNDIPQPVNTSSYQSLHLACGNIPRAAVILWSWKPSYPETKKWIPLFVTSHSNTDHITIIILESDTTGRWVAEVGSVEDLTTIVSPLLPESLASVYRNARYNIQLEIYPLDYSLLTAVKRISFGIGEKRKRTSISPTPSPKKARLDDTIDYSNTPPSPIKTTQTKTQTTTPNNNQNRHPHLAPTPKPIHESIPKPQNIKIKPEPGSIPFKVKQEKGLPKDYNDVKMEEPEPIIPSIPVIPEIQKEDIVLTKCPICNQNQNVLELSCSHRICRICLEQWGANTTCPTCGKDIIVPKNEKVENGKHCPKCGNTQSLLEHPTQFICMPCGKEYCLKCGNEHNEEASCPTN